MSMFPAVWYSDENVNEIHFNLYSHRRDLNALKKMNE